MISNKKFVLDMFLMILLLLLMYVGITGGLIHEWLGIIFTIVVFIHLIFNYSWIKSITKNFKNVKDKIKIIYMINIIVFISYFITIITGILISKYIFLFINVSTSLTIEFHYIFAYISLILTFIHLLMHYKEIKNTIKMKINSNYNKEISFSILILISALFIFVIYDKKELLKINTKKDEIYKEDLNGSSSKTIIKSSNESSDTPPSLYDYLSKLHCGGCGNRCLLTSLRCGRGEVYKTQAESDYNEKYNN